MGVRTPKIFQRDVCELWLDFLGIVVDAYRFPVAGLI
jgi:hypothetical protein